MATRKNSVLTQAHSHTGADGDASIAAPRRVRYENRHTDFYCRSDGEFRVPLQCNPHLHYHIEFFCMLDGQTEAFADADEYVVRTGDIFMVFPNQVHRFISESSEKYRLFIVSPDLMPEFLPIFTESVPRSALLPGAALDPMTDALTEALFSVGNGGQGEGGEYRDAEIRGYLLALFGRLLPRMSFASPRTGDSRALREVVGYCSRHYDDDLSLETLEEELHLSKYYISHLFSGRLGIRFTDYVNSLRVSHACRYLRREEMQVTEIAEAVGFNTLRTFNRAFLRFRGVSPSEYRRQEQGSRRAEPASVPPAGTLHHQIKE